MKLASALSERGDLQKKIAEMKTRLGNNAKVQEGEEPAEDPMALLAELDKALQRLEYLIRRINLTNCAVSINGTTMTEMLARRDCLRTRISIMRGFLDQASEKVDRYSKTEIRVFSTVDVAALQKDVDRTSAELRELDERIQEMNWTNDLKE